MWEWRRSRSWFWDARECAPGPWGRLEERSRDPGGTDVGRLRGREIAAERPRKASSALSTEIARRRRPRGLNRPRRGRDPAPGRVRPMPSTGGNDHPARQAAGVKLVPPRRRHRGSGTARRPIGGLRGLHLDPGSGRMVPATRVGRFALRAAAPPGEGAEGCFAVGCSSLGTFSTRFTDLVGCARHLPAPHGGRDGGMPPCVAIQVTRPIRNQEAPAAEPRLA
jgi:hypothetical protein